MMPRTPAGRPGLNWLELTVVAAVLAGLIGLLLPAVCRVREAAARTTCANNLKLIGLAVGSYESVHGHFPSGTAPHPDLPPDRRLSWVVAIVPFIESTPWALKVAPKAAWDGPPNREFTATPYAWFACPTVGDRARPGTSYVGVAGVGPDAAALTAGDPRAGVFGYDRATKGSDVADGLAATLLLLETGTAGPWAQGGPGTVKGLDPADRPYLGPGRPYTGHDGEKRLVGRNRVGGNVALADGAVRFVGEAVAPEVLEALATVAGKEELPADW